MWRRQLAQMCALMGPRCKKGARRASAQKEPKRDPALKKRCAKITRGDKNPTEHHNRAAGAPETQDGPQQKNEREQPTTTKATIPLVILPMRVRPNSQKNHGNTVVSTMFQQNRMGAKCKRLYARSSPPDGGPSSKFYIYIYIFK